VLRWHRAGFRLFWRWRSCRGRPGRPALDRAVIALIQRMASDNSTWGAPRIRAELHLLGHDLAESTVARYMPERRKPPSQRWRTFLNNHAGCLASIDIFTVPTATFSVLYGFVVLCHHRRRVVHCNVTRHPTAAWVSQQLREAFPFAQAPRYLIRDRDGAYGDEVRQCLRDLGIQEVLTAPRSPWQNPYVERQVGTLRRELLDRVIVLGERHLFRLLRSYLDYYHRARCHQSLDGNAPESRDVEGPEPMVGGLHHRYRRAA